MGIGPRLRELRRDGRMTQVELADASGIPQGTISRIESGAYKEIPPPEIVNPIAGALRVSSTVLLEAAGYHIGEEDAPEPDRAELTAVIAHAHAIAEALPLADDAARAALVTVLGLRITADLDAGCVRLSFRDRFAALG